MPEGVQVSLSLSLAPSLDIVFVFGISCFFYFFHRRPLLYLDFDGFGWLILEFGVLLDPRALI